MARRYRMLLATCLTLMVCQTALARIFYSEDFDSYKAGSLPAGWVDSKQGGEKHNTLVVGQGQWEGSRQSDLHLMTTEDYSSYAASVKLPVAITPASLFVEQKPLVVQFQIKHEQDVECAGGFLKLFGPGFEQEQLDGQSDYVLTFGPDICGTQTRDVLVRFAGGGVDSSVTTGYQSPHPAIRCEMDHVTHTYTLVIHHNGVYEVFIDFYKRAEGDVVRHGMVPVGGGKEIHLDEGQQLDLGTIAYAGFEFWQVRSGTVIDNLVLADNFEEAQAYAGSKWTDEDKQHENRLWKQHLSAIKSKRREQRERLQIERERRERLRNLEKSEL